jgi:arginine/ornithine N-succinyltransferase beta subunit
VQERVDRLTGTLRDAMRVLAATSEELQQEVDRGQQLVAKLEADARTYEELARVNRAQAEAVAVLVRGELETEGRRSFWKQFGMNFGFFLAGAVVSVLVPAVFGS